MDRQSMKQMAAKADAGDPDAIEFMAECYMVGFIVKQDFGKAERLYSSLIEKIRPTVRDDNPAEAFRLGFALRLLAYVGEKRSGTDAVKATRKEAYDWIRKAALLGQPEAQETLSLDYFRGNGVPKDAIEAYAWEITAARYQTNPQKKSELERTVANDARRVEPDLWTKAMKRSEEFIAQIEAAGK